MSGKHPGGRPTKYGDDIIAQATHYLTHWNEIDEIPSDEGLAAHLQIGKTTLYRWAGEEGKEEFRDILELLEMRRAKHLINKGLNGEFNSAITKLLLTKHGYSDKAEVDNKTDMKVEGAIGVFSPPEMSKEEWMEYMRGNRNQDRKPKP